MQLQNTSIFLSLQPTKMQFFEDKSQYFQGSLFAKGTNNDRKSAIVHITHTTYINESQFAIFGAYVIYKIYALNTPKSSNRRK